MFLVGYINFQVAALFDEHPDLLDEFTRFLPDASAAASAHHAQYGRNSFPRFNERSSATPTFRPMHMDKVCIILFFYV